MTEEQLQSFIDKPIHEDECIVYGNAIGMTDEQSLIFYFHYESIGWMLEREDGSPVPIRNWRSRMSLWKLKDHVLQRVAAKVQSAKLEHWKRQQERRSAERKRENQLSAKGIQQNFNATEGWFDYAWYQEQVHVHGPKVNQRLEQSTINGKPVWRYK